ncbi:MAG: hypothetical protein WBE13_23705 [Candidatus Acidiferrum sp.]
MENSTESSNEMPDELHKGTIGEISENLGTLFRHFLPAILIFCAARVAYPSWFTGLNAMSWAYLSLLAAIAFAIGNTWFSINRYVVHQAVDCLSWRFGLEGPARRGGAEYTTDLAKYVREAVVEIRVPPRARQHVAFRASSVLLVYTLAELLMLMLVDSEPTSPIYGLRARLLLASSGAILFGVGVWQNVITRRIDAAVLHKDRVV